MAIETTDPSADKAPAAVTKIGHDLYRVERVVNGCATCAVGSEWGIEWIDEDGEPCSLGRAFKDESEADEICELMNQGYNEGRHEVCAHLKNLIGLVQLITNNPGVQDWLKEVLATNWRYTEALAYSNKLDEVLA